MEKQRGHLKINKKSAPVCSQGALGELADPSVFTGCNGLSRSSGRLLLVDSWLSV